MSIPLAYLTSSDDGTIHGVYDEKTPINPLRVFGAPEEVHWIHERNWPSQSDIESQIRKHLESKPFKDKDEINAFIAQSGVSTRRSEGYSHIMFCSISPEDYQRARKEEIIREANSRPMHIAG